MRINQNIAALNSYRNLSNNSTGVAKSLEKLSSGTRINRAADDASGLVISQGLRAQIGGLNQATRNAQDGISVVQTAEGALNEVHTMLGRMRDLAVQASNTGSNDTAGRTAAQKEVTELSTEINRLADTTKFGSTKLLSGGYGAKFEGATGAEAFASVTVVNDANDKFDINVGGVAYADVDVAAGVYDTPDKLVAALNTAVASRLSATNNTVTFSASVGPEGTTINASSNVTFALTTATTSADDVLASVGDGSFSATAQTGTGGSFQVGADNTENDRISVSITDTHTSTLFGGGGTLDLIGGAGAAIDTIDAAIATVSDTRAQLGAKQNRFESVISNLQVATENLSSSESRIRDTDYAQEMVKFTRGQILNQAATSMLGQANRLPQSVLGLLQG